MAERCFLDCPELFESLDESYGYMGPFGDLSTDSPDEDEPIIPEEAAAVQEDLTRCSRILDLIDNNRDNCEGPVLVYLIKNRKPYLVCPITLDPYQLPIA